MLFIKGVNVTSYYEIIEKSRKRKRKAAIIALILLASLVSGFFLILINNSKNSQEKTNANRQIKDINVPNTGSGSPRTMLAGFYELPSPGGPLPANETAGPLRVGGESNPVVSGFAHSELGASLAGLHLLERVRPYVGPSVFVPTIQTQMIGKGNDVQMYLEETKEIYSKTYNNVPNQPLAVSRTAEYVGYRVVAYSDLYAVVQYLLEFPAPQTQAESNTSTAAKFYGQEIAVLWKDSDWLLMAQTGGKLAPIMTDVDPNAFIRFK